MSDITARLLGIPAAPSPETLPNPTALPPGMVVPGNINLEGRPIRLNPDGSVSSEYSMSFGTGQGEVLVPTVINGKFLTPDGTEPPRGHIDSLGRYQPSPEERAMAIRAQERYRRTREHMGIFASPETADAYARQAHSRPMDLHDPTYIYGGAAAPSESQLRALRQRIMGGR